jgi:hypothetical protein
MTSKQPKNQRAVDGPDSGEYRSGTTTGTTVIRTFTQGEKEVQYSEIDGLAIFEGDIVLGTVKQIKAETVLEGVGITGVGFRWPNARVPFEVDPNLPDPQRVTDAVAHWAVNTPVRFVPRADTDNDFVRFVPSTASRSAAGRRGGRQDIELSDEATAGTVIHEMGHALGLFHEQSREDRNSMVTINFANIPDADEHNFAQHITDGDDIGGYDFGSIMHYSGTAFSSNGQATIVPKVPLPPGVVMGQRDGLSFGDRAAIHALYRGWFPDWVPLPGQHVFDHRTQQIAAVSRGPQNLDLFVIGLDNRVYTQFWNGDWHFDWVPLPGQHVFDHKTQQIAAVSRGPQNLDVFVIGLDNRVYTQFWNGDWHVDWVPLPGQHVFDSKTQQIAAVSRGPQNLDVFVLGLDDRAYTQFWN